MLIVQGPAVEVLQAVGKVVLPHPVLFDAPPALVLPPVLVVPPGEKVDIFFPYLSLASAKVLPQTENDLYFVPAEGVKLLR